VQTEEALVLFSGLVVMKQLEVLGGDLGSAEKFKGPTLRVKQRREGRGTRRSMTEVSA